MLKTIRKASEKDVDRIMKFLQEAKVSTADVDSQLHPFLLLESDNGEVLATLGIHMQEGKGLLRSLVISPCVEQYEVVALFREAFKFAVEERLEKIYLYTKLNSAVDFFHLLGFQKVDVDDSPSFVKSYKQFSEAILMEKSFSV
ncbi:N-acetylglutamate synthase-like GNAT family acetyltransferase [Oikeobacillus pervagus]|uniref:N-acetylglutamate synthase-like GNAT family acetyltransferase n=1 Tax=Oikeobacillus pervagus TaxID=1325931 RepID=A0AAJ1WFN8_9BACI|nr:N-acetylglutamate synthase-like GNAT family acetyltransferase [Oikeobacillus pervagus]